MLRSVRWFLVAAVLCGCGGEGSYRLSIEFPDETLRLRTTEVAIWVLEPAGRSCGDFMSHLVDPGTFNPIVDMLVKVPPASGATLREIPQGSFLFVAEGRDVGGAKILRGCSPGEVKAGATVHVTVRLEQVCWPDPLGEDPTTAEDDDCDGLINECTGDADCDDQNGCTMDICLQEECHFPRLDEGTLCNDNNLCTFNDACSSDGECLGQPKDCTDFNRTCLLGVCDPQTGACTQEPAPDGSGCDDGVYCTQDDTCQGSTCTGAPLDCDDGDQCTQDVCNEGEGRCDHPLQPQPGAEQLSLGNTCANGVDDDCDGLTDGADPNCSACTADSECEDYNQCTQDSCTSGECQNYPLTDGAPCDDGAYCTVEDVCTSASCGGRPRDCSGLSDECHTGLCKESQQNCVADSKPDGTVCDDGAYCTVGDGCQAGMCQPGDARDCDDGERCTVDSCNEGIDACDHDMQPIPDAEGPPGDSNCSNQVDDDCDGLTDLEDGSCFECTSGDDCTDTNPCTSDLCTDGLCSNPPVANGTSCDDGLYCTDPDVCTDGLCDGPDTDCSALGDQCNLGLCDEGADACAAAPKQDGTGCDDGDACTMGDACTQGSCSGEPQDEDQDGFVSDSCGGQDCNDQDAGVNPGVLEGPPGDSTCSDSKDNNCDGLTDLQAAGCVMGAVVCSVDNWCWMHPQPTGRDLNAIWGSGTDDIWVVGDQGTILHFDGDTWSIRTGPTSDDLEDVYGVDASHVWAAGGNGTIIHFNGGQWTPQQSNTTEHLRMLWASGVDDAWAVAPGLILRTVGGAWQDTGWGTGHAIRGIYGFAADNVWVVGATGGPSLCRHYDGNTWEDVTTGIGGTCYCIWGLNDDDMWSGCAATIIHWIGDHWEVEYDGFTSYYDAWGTATDSVWIVGESLRKWDGTELFYENPGVTWTEYNFMGISGVWGTSDDNVWAVGPGGFIAHRDAVGWSCLSQKTTSIRYGITGTADDDVWVVGSFGEILRYDGNGWSYQKTDPDRSLSDAWALAENDVWIVGGSGTIFHWDGSSMHDESYGGDFDNWEGVWAAASDDVWVVGGAGVVHKTAAGWEEVSELSGSYYGVWGTAQNDVWVVGANSIQQYNGSTWTDRTPAGFSGWIMDVWGTGPSDAWAAVSDGRALQWDGNDWTEMQIDASAYFNCIYGRAPNDYWIVGDYGVIYHWDGNTWSPQDGGTERDLQAVWGTPTGSVWAAGGRANIIRLQP